LRAALVEPVRGRVYGAVIREDLGEKYYLVVSNNRRNRALGDVLVVRLTTSPKPALPTVVEMGPADAPFVGRVLCDDIEALYKDEITREIGALSPATMRRVDGGLAAALSLTTN
jgi:mRNA interferase MazF